MEGADKCHCSRIHRIISPSYLVFAAVKQQHFLLLIRPGPCELQEAYIDAHEVHKAWEILQWDAHPARLRIHSLAAGAY